MPTTKTRERRALKGLEIRDAAGEKDGRIATLTGYAAVFNVWSQDLGYFRELIKPGAFADSLKRGDDVRALAHHDSAGILGRRSAGTLSLEEDSHGLKVQIALPDTTAGRDMLTSVKRGDVSGMSFAFDVVDDEWARETVDGEAVLKRELRKVDLFEVSVVTWPAYTQTEVEARSLEQLATEGKRRVGMDARPALARRDRIIAAHKARMALWT